MTFLSLVWSMESKVPHAFVLELQTQVMPHLRVHWVYIRLRHRLSMADTLRLLTTLEYGVQGALRFVLQT